MVQFRTGAMTDGIKCCWCMHSKMVCVTVCSIPSGIGPVENCTSAKKVSLQLKSRIGRSQLSNDTCI